MANVLSTLKQLGPFLFYLLLGVAVAAPAVSTDGT